MRSQLVPFFILFMSIALLVPPAVLIAHARKKLRHAVMASHKTTYRFVLGIAVASFLFNDIYIFSLIARSEAPQLAGDWAMAIALTLSWICFWTRPALSRVNRWRSVAP